MLNKVPDVRLDKHKGKLGKGWRQAASQHCQRNRCVTVLCLLIAAAAGVLVVNSGGMARLMDAAAMPSDPPTRSIDLGCAANEGRGEAGFRAEGSLIPRL